MKLSIAFDNQADKLTANIKRCEDAGHKFTICAREHNDSVINVWREAARMAREAGQ